MTDAAFTALALRGTDRLIGDCAAHVDADDPRQAEIGFTLAPEHQGHGYATEAVRRLLHYLLVERGKHRVSATCDARNTRSAALLERVGMRREGHLLESTWSKGEWTNDLLYAVLRREWPPADSHWFGLAQGPLGARRSSLAQDPWTSSARRRQPRQGAATGRWC